MFSDDYFSDHFLLTSDQFLFYSLFTGQESFPIPVLVNYFYTELNIALL